MPLVFISASSLDYQYAEPIYRFLKSEGLSVFFSQESLPELASSDYRKQIDDALDRAEHMIVVTSARVNAESPWVEAEWGLFINEKRSGRKTGNLITVIVRDLKPSDLPASLRYYEVIVFQPESFQKILQYVKPRQGEPSPSSLHPEPSVLDTEVRLRAAEKAKQEEEHQRVEATRQRLEAEAQKRKRLKEQQRDARSSFVQGKNLEEVMMELISKGATDEEAEGLVDVTLRNLMFDSPVIGKEFLTRELIRKGLGAQKAEEIATAATEARRLAWRVSGAVYLGTMVALEYLVHVLPYLPSSNDPWITFILFLMGLVLPTIPAGFFYEIVKKRRLQR